MTQDPYIQQIIGDSRDGLIQHLIEKKAPAKDIVPLIWNKQRVMLDFEGITKANEAIVYKTENKERY